MSASSGGGRSLRRAAYLGDISALAALPPWCNDADAHASGGLLAGSGPDVQWFDPSGVLRCSAQLFEGARVHGLHVVAGSGSSDSVHVAAHGGRQVGLFRLRRVGAGGAVERVALLPGFLAWVLDVRALREDGAAPPPAGAPPTLLAVGLSDNAVEVWCVATRTLRWRSACTERALLYSLALLGDTPASLRAASGTIFNDVLLWRPAASADDALVPPAARLCGHEGSVHRLHWARCGTRLCSASDDRTARVWHVPAATWAPRDAPLAVAPALSLFGHTGRVWDARFIDADVADGAADAPQGSSLLATVSEDATARLWRLPGGAPLAVLQGHRGRGIWRCAAAGGALATGGADGGVKLWRLADWLAADGAGGTPGEGDTEALVLPEEEHAPPPAHAGDAAHHRVKDSSSEFSRCVAVASPQLLLVATNRGLLRAAHAPPHNAAPPRWSPPLHATPGGVPLMCMRVAPACAAAPLGAGVAARVLLGDMSGGATVLDVLESASPDGTSAFAGRVIAQWCAHALGRTLAVFWLDCGDECLPATADALGALKLWRIRGGSAAAQLVASALLPHRVLCAAAAPQPPGGPFTATLLCGDQKGGVTAFGLVASGDAVAEDDTLRCLGTVKRAHAATAVTLVQCGACELTSAGGDGYICTYALQPTCGECDASVSLVRTGRRHVAAISAVEALHEDAGGASGGAATLAAGVTANDVVVWDVRNACELLRLPCGSWRRPHACTLGPGGRFVIAFLRGNALHVRRRWPDAGADAAAGVLHAAGPHAHRSLALGHHGREVHAALLVPPPEGGGATCCALLTGSEDGTLFHVYFDPADVALDADASPAPQRPALRGSALLAETAGGTAVRAVELVRHPAGGWFLLSAGAKEVLMCWHLTWRASGAAPPELHARVLSVQARPDDAFHRSWRAGAAAPSDAAGGDQRHLALAGFVAAGRLFAAVSSSDGTLNLWSLPADAGSGVRWSFVAALQLGRRPVLAMSHLAVGDAHWLVSGATDGAVAIWDVTCVTSVAAPQPAAVETVLLPAAVLRCAHQSGVNAVSVARAPAALAAALGASPHAWVLVTGGDDQALNAIVLELLPPSGDVGAARVRVAAAVRDPGAHVSALKSLWTDGAAVLTASLDQRLRMWRLEASCDDAPSAATPALDAPWLARASDADAPPPCIDLRAWWRGSMPARLRLAAVDACLSEVQDCEALAALPLAARAGYVVAVAGRGTQVFRAGAI